MSTSSRIVIPLVAIGLALNASAQNRDPGRSTDSNDKDWDRLARVENAVPNLPTESVPTPNGAAKGGASASASAIASECLQRAGELRDFAAKHPGDARCSEAHRLEALMLVKAALHGDSTQAARCDQLVGEVRRDASLPAEKRYPIAALADNRAVSQGGAGPQDNLIGKYEKIARGHVREFAGVPQTYEALLRVAQSSDDAGAVRIANDLLAMPASPAVKDGARSLLARHALVGTSLGSMLAGAVDADQLAELKKSRVVILYQWAASVPNGVVLARLVTDHAPKRSAIIGINLDPDAAAARTAAKALLLRGLQMFGAPARNLSDRLKLTSLPIVLGTDQDGVIRSVSATFAFEPQIVDSAN